MALLPRLGFTHAPAQRGCFLSDPVSGKELETEHEGQTEPPSRAGAPRGLSCFRRCPFGEEPEQMTHPLRAVEFKIRQVWTLVCWQLLVCKNKPKSRKSN